MEMARLGWKVGAGKTHCTEMRIGAICAEKLSIT